MLLTDAERSKFAEYLEQDCESDRLILQQMARMDAAWMANLMRERRQTLAAKLIVAKMLREGIE